MYKLNEEVVFNKELVIELSEVKSMVFEKSTRARVVKTTKGSGNFITLFIPTQNVTLGLSEKECLDHIERYYKVDTKTDMTSYEILN